MSQHSKYFSIALKAIREAGFDPNLRAYLGVVIVKGGTVISVAVNTNNYDCYAQKYAHHADLCTTHAEMAAINLVKRRIDLTGTKMWIARLTKTGHLGMSKPCPTCQEVIARHGIKRVTYTVNDDTHAVWRVPRVDLRIHSPQLR